MSVSIPDPLTSPDTWDVVLVNAAPSPGTARVVGASEPRKWDKQDGTAQSGATIKFNGDGLAEFSVILTFWEAAHFTEWSTFKRVLRAPDGDRSKALDIYHPALEDLGVSAVVVTEIGQIEPAGEDGMWSVAIKFLQYRAPKPASAVPKGSGGASAPKAPWKGGYESETTDARDEYDDLIDKLKGQLEDEANK